MIRYGTLLARQGTAERSPLLAGDVPDGQVDFNLLAWMPEPDARPH
jgi:hypothetical protein